MLNTIDLPKKAVNSPIYADSYDRTMVSNCRLIKIQISVLDVFVGNLHIPIGGSQKCLPRRQLVNSRYTGQMAHGYKRVQVKG